MTPKQLEKIRKLCDKNFKVGTFPETISRDELLYLGGCAGGMIALIDKQEKEITRLEANSEDLRIMLSGERAYNSRRASWQRAALKKLGEKVRAKHRAWREEQDWHDIDLGRVKRLEDALVEERARRIYPYSMPRWETLQEDDHHVVTFGGIEDRYGKKSYRRIARAQLRAEGVIG